METEVSQIEEFYAGKSILVTGFTGFLGKVLVEKLLRHCPRIEKIYVLLRPKKGDTASNRLKSTICKWPFTFHQQTIDNLHKLVPISGDLCKLDISSQDKETLRNNVSVIIHCAAEVKFDAKLESNILCNTKGAQNIIEFGCTIKNLKSYIHVSTAYSFCDRDKISEQVYQLDIDMDLLTERISHENPNLDFLKDIEKKFPNSYTLTKAIGEMLVAKYEGKIPIAIARPSMIIPSLKDPQPGWIDGVQGFSGISIAAQVGLLQIVDWNYWSRADVMPVDVCSNAIITMPWYLNEKCDPSKLFVFNITSGSIVPITWGQIFHEAREAAIRNPTIKQLRPLMNPPKFKRAPFYYPLQKFLYHSLFAMFFDLIITIMGYKAFLFRLATKLNHALDLVRFFTTNQFTFDNKNFLNMATSMNSIDSKLFVSMKNDINVKDFVTDCVRGTKKFVLKDESSYEEAQRHVKLVNIFYRLFQTVLFLLIWQFISLIFGISTFRILKTTVSCLLELEKSYITQVSNTTRVEIL